MSPPPDAFVKWVTTIAAGLVLLSIPYIGNEISDLRSEVADLNLRLVVIETTLKLRGNDHDLVMRIKQDVDSLSSRVEKLETNK